MKEYMQEYIKAHIDGSTAKSMKVNSKAFIKWMAIAIVIGLVVGFISTMFHYAIEYATEFRYDHPWMLYLLPVAGVLIVGIYRHYNAENHRGTDFILASIRENKPITTETSIMIFFSTVITHLCGGSSGREGAALQLGGSLADYFGKLIKLDEKDMSLITIVGMCTAFAALFGTPLTAVVFSIEVVSIGIMHYSALFPCVVSAVTACMLAWNMGVHKTFFSVIGVPALTPEYFIRVALLAIMGAILSVVFCRSMHAGKKFYKKYFKNKFTRAIAGGFIIIALTLLVGNRHYNGAGMEMIQFAFVGKVVWYAFILKIIFTSLTLGAGFRGGEIVPAFFTGATFGNVAAPLVGLSPSFGAGIGLISVFCGVTNCPIASIILSIELFGTDGVLFYALACAIGYLLSGYTGLYSEQKILYSKTRAEYININAE